MNKKINMEMKYDWKIIGYSWMTIQVIYWHSVWRFYNEKDRTL